MDASHEDLHHPWDLTPEAARALQTRLAPRVERGDRFGPLKRVAGVRPVFVSTGHRVALDAACQLVLQAAPRYRLPEPIRRADRIASRRDGAPGEAAAQKR